MYEKNLSITETSLTGETLDSMQKGDPSRYQAVTVRGQPGLVYAELGNTIDIIWFENMIKYTLWGIYDGQPVEVWLSIAESMK